MHLTSLKILQIEECEQLVSVGGLHVLLSSLRFLTVLECPGLFTDLTAAADVATDPNVDALSPPDHGLSLLACLGVDNFSLLPVLLSRKGLDSLTTIALVRSSQNTAFTREQEEWFQHLPSLRFLIFYECERLPSLPSNLTTLTCLKQLHIRDCPQWSQTPLASGQETSKCCTKLAIDPLISFIGARRVSYLDGPSVLPCVGNDAYGPVPEGDLALPLEAYASPSHAITLIQQRSPVVKGMMVEFAKNLAHFISISGKKHVIVLSSLSSGRKKIIDPFGSIIHQMLMLMGLMVTVKSSVGKDLMSMTIVKDGWVHLKYLAEGNPVDEEMLSYEDELFDEDYYPFLPDKAIDLVDEAGFFRSCKHKTCSGPYQQT
ncbi:hypothetical protein J5N97_027664 [Dioscorea zingiberensis]|uniref:Proteasome assembly chaperone 2 n=1 Tax=Dioscorea zingiberensis TaxID=325984 RepID=A0A9D5BX05_9LILI|nr:hypothetical protein J5N97_027664 [Dioscorea zingiberensis]